MSNEKSKIWEELLKNKDFQENLQKLPEDEKVELQKALQALVEQFETNIIKPLQK